MALGRNPISFIFLSPSFFRCSFPGGKSSLLQWWGEKIKEKGEREQKNRTQFSARIFPLGWQIKKELKEVPDGEFLAALMSQPLTFGHVSQKAPADSPTYSQRCALGTGSGLIHPWLGNQSPNPVWGVSNPTPLPLNWTPQAQTVPYRDTTPSCHLKCTWGSDLSLENSISFPNISFFVYFKE